MFGRLRKHIPFSCDIDNKSNTTDKTCVYHNNTTIFDPTKLLTIVTHEQQTTRAFTGVSLLKDQNWFIQTVLNPCLQVHELGKEAFKWVYIDKSMSVLTPHKLGELALCLMQKKPTDLSTDNLYQVAKDKEKGIEECTRMKANRENAFCIEAGPQVATGVLFVLDNDWDGTDNPPSIKQTLLMDDKSDPPITTTITDDDVTKSTWKNHINLVKFIFGKAPAPPKEVYVPLETKSMTVVYDHHFSEYTFAYNNEDTSNYADGNQEKVKRILKHSIDGWKRQLQRLGTLERLFASSNQQGQVEFVGETGWDYEESL